MDISRPPSDYTPKKPNGSPGGVYRSLALLLLAMGIGTLFGFAGTWMLQLISPSVPSFVGLAFGIVGMIIALRFIADRYEWILPWYYLLPSILFLLTFTFFPVILTIILAFTDYAGIRNGALSISTETPIVAVNGTEVTIAEASTLRCDRLQGSRLGCNNIRGLVYASGQLEVTGTALDGVTLTVDPAPPADRTITSAEITIPSVGFAAQFPVESVAGKQITLGRAPPADADFESIKLTLDRESINTRILSVSENTVTLANPLPDGRDYVSLARYNAFGWVGLDNFKVIMAQANRALLPVFLWNILFAVGTIIINTIAGLFMALLLNNPELRFRNLYRTLLIVPWALPGIITIQVWRGFLNENFGAINRLLALLDLNTLNWLGDPTNAKLAILLVNLWLGLPFMMTACLGALSAIPRELYEAARIDGANIWQQFRGVTAPLLRSALVPITLTGFAFNFNNFNLIYLLTDGGPPVSWGTSTARGTDILISWAYNEAFRSQGGYAYGLGSAISILIFVVTIGISLVNFRVTGALKEEGER